MRPALRRIVRYLLSGFLACTPVTAAWPADAPGRPQAAPPGGTVVNKDPLPGGATSSQEIHGDWRVVCGPQKDKTLCVLAQQQSHAQTRQLMLAIELTAGAGDTVVGTLVLPFGLAVDRGVALQADGAPVGPELRFRTCLPVGCLIAMNFESPMLATLRKAPTLGVKATAATGQEAAFTVSLKGFGEALDRVRTLTGRTAATTKEP